MECVGRHEREDRVHPALACEILVDATPSRIAATAARVSGGRSKPNPGQSLRGSRLERRLFRNRGDDDFLAAALENDTPDAAAK